MIKNNAMLSLYRTGFVLCWIILPVSLTSQVPWDNLADGDAHYQAKEYAQALESYQPLLVYYNDQKTLLKAARAAAQVGAKKKALVYLKRVVDLGWTKPQTLEYDRELEPVQEERKFSKLIARVERMEARRTALNQPELVAELEAIYADDQKYRRRKGMEEEQAQLDSMNRIRLEKLIHQHGWLGSNLLSGRNYCWVVIQHQPLEVQQKYVGLMAKAVKKGEESAAFLAFLQDQMLVSMGKPQKYGTQVDHKNKRLFPVETPEKVDIYRAEMGLGPIQALLDRYQIDKL